MTDYKRMVSYMYQYENGIKRKNVGFVRVEAKGGQCKITLHMQLLGQLDSVFPTYLIQRGKKNIELIYLGDTLLKNQVMDSKLTADENNIMGSGAGLSDMGGLLLFLNDNIFFATEWDDKPVVAKDVMDALKPKQGRRSVSKKEYTSQIFQAAGNSQAKEEPSRLLEEELSIPRYKLPGGFKMIERQQKEVKIRLVEELNNKAAEKEEHQETGGNIEAENIAIKEAVYIKYEEVQERKDKGAEARSKKPEEIKERKSRIIENEYLHTRKIQEKKTDIIEAAAVPGKDIPDKMTEMIEKAVIHEDEKGAEAEVFEVNEETPDPGSFTEDRLIADSTEQIRPEIIEQSTDPLDDEKDASAHYETAAPELKETSQTDYSLPDHPTARKFLESYPRIYPFEDDEILLCVKIEPKDIGVLPKELWPFSNNSFLLHGFYCYHHLIFAKMKNKTGYRYILGIPGIYHNREQFMARMFGFESFKSIHKKELKQGDFGYWYVFVYL